MTPRLPVKISRSKKNLPDLSVDFSKLDSNVHENSRLLATGVEINFHFKEVF